MSESNINAEVKAQINNQSKEVKYWETITELAEKQTEKGLNKYGSVLEDSLYLTGGDRLQHLQEELVDALMYTEHLKIYLTNTVPQQADANLYQKLALRTDDRNRTEKERLVNCALGLTGEAGEVADHIKKYMHHGHELDEEKVVKELGDVLWYVAVMSSVMGFSLSHIMEQNILKLKKRYPDGFSSLSSINRTE